MKIGIFGGTFNPIHTGHAILANYISQHCDIDQLWLMITPQNPLKGNADPKMDAARIRMAQMVANRCLNVSVSAFEFSMPRPSYSIDTLEELSKKFANDSFTLIIGADNWINFEKWKDYKKILDNYNIIIYPRAGFEPNVKELPYNVTYLKDAPIIEISSSLVREGLKNDKDMSFFLPDEVYAYIIRNSLYQI